MDFIVWCHHLLQTLEDERFHSHLSTHALQSIMFGEEAQQSTFHTSDARRGMFDAIEVLSKIGLVEEGQYKLKITPLGRQVLASPTDYWTMICEQNLDPEEQAVLNFVNNLCPQKGTNPNHAWLKDVAAKDLLGAFNIHPPPMQSNEHGQELSKYIYDLPKLLEDRNFMKTRGRAGYHNDLRSTYQGLVWGTRRGFTIESKLIDDLVKEWETTNVDFKREVSLDTKKQKAEFAGTSNHQIKRATLPHSGIR